MDERVEREGLGVDARLAAFVEERLLPGTGVAEATFWEGLSGLIHGFGDANRALLDTRARLARQIDHWHSANPGTPDPDAYRGFLEEIGYLVPEGAPFTLSTGPTDPEIGQLAGPQLVVPVKNARYALNAANARWGSLYDALYGTDALGTPPRPGGFDPARGAQVVAWGRDFLDAVLPLAAGSHREVTGYAVAAGALVPALADPSALAGFQGDPAALSAILLRHHGLHVILRIDRTHPIGASDKAGVADIVLEAALSAIMDGEDSVAAVDAPDKIEVWGNWLGLMKGDLTEEVVKNGRAITRRLVADLEFTAPDGGPLVLKGRALMWVRNVGHLMTTPAILDREGREAFEGLVDAMMTVTAALHDLRGPGANSVTGSVYIVKPKMHGPDEVAFADAVFTAVEAALGLPHGTVKMGLMDEERRSSVNLAECIRAAAGRIAFINTGFLDRTGDEINASMEAGPMLRKGDMKGQPWLSAYEDRNVDIGLACGLPGRAQIGKGMWAAPDRMAAMLAEKIAHPRAGASCAWVPSPTAAVLHATHYHRVDVAARQREIGAQARPRRLGDLLTLPLAAKDQYTPAEITREVETNAQGILGYVVRWVDQGIGCSKVPDLDDIGLMEDRATCRISAQMLANWLHHGLIAPEDLRAALRRMAVVVDRQNANDPAYRPMGPRFDGHAFAAAEALVFMGRAQPSGYTEPLLHAHRAAVKAEAG